MRELPSPAQAGHSIIAKLGIPAIILIVLAICTAYGSYFTVDAGHAAVIKRFGAIQETVYLPGLHWKIPFIETDIHVDTTIQDVKATAGAASNDTQTVTAVVNVPYYINPSLLPQLINGLGTGLGVRENLKTIIAPAIQESVKSATAQYSATDLIQKRDEVKAKVITALDNYINITLATKGARGGAPVANVAVSDFDFSDKFNAAIEEKVKMDEDAKRAEIEKKKLITEAEAKTAQAKLAADAEAYQLEKVSTQRAAAIDREGKAMRENAGVAQLRAIEKWNGVLPVYNNGPLPIAIMDVTKPTPLPTAAR